MSNTKKMVIGLSIFAVIFLAVLGTCLGTTSNDNPTTQTEVPAETQSSPELIYLSALTTSSKQIGNQLQILSGDLSEADLYSEDWKSQVSVDLELLKIYIDDARNLNPPSSLKYINDEYMQALDHYYIMADLLDEAIKTLNIDLLDQALIEMNAGTEHVNEATALLDNYGK